MSLKWLSKHAKAWLKSSGSRSQSRILSGTRSEHFYHKLRVLDSLSCVLFWNIKYTVKNHIQKETFSSTINTINLR